MVYLPVAALLESRWEPQWLAPLGLAHCIVPIAVLQLNGRASVCRPARYQDPYPKVCNEHACSGWEIEANQVNSHHLKYGHVIVSQIHINPALRVAPR